MIEENSEPVDRPISPTETLPKKVGMRDENSEPVNSPISPTRTLPEEIEMKEESPEPVNNLISPTKTLAAEVGMKDENSEPINSPNSPMKTLPGKIEMIKDNSEPVNYTTLPMKTLPGKVGVIEDNPEPVNANTDIQGMQTTSHIRDIKKTTISREEVSQTIRISEGGVLETPIKNNSNTETVTSCAQYNQVYRFNRGHSPYTPQKFRRTNHQPIQA